MSSNGSRRKVSEAVPGDEQQGAYPRDQLLKMDEKFCARLEHAIRRGKEHTPFEGVRDTPSLTRPRAAAVRQQARYVPDR